MDTEIAETANLAPPPPVTSGRNHIEAWIAKLVSGEEVRSDQCESYDFLPGPVESVTIRVDGVEHHVSCVPALGQRLRWFTRRAFKFGGSLVEQSETENMPIVEIMIEGSDLRPRLYLHPRHGVMFSTLDLQL